jgi:phosphatidylserine decarboxylase
LRPSAYRAFARATGADLAEAELPLAAYRSLGDFFARRLRLGARPIDPDPAGIACPCDGVLASTGAIVRGGLVQAKGRDYELAELVADDALARALDGGSYATIYLAPRDYHRVHAPVAGRLVGADVVPGARWPVNPRIAARRDRLFARNERVVMRLDGGPLGPFVVVMVAATGVGHVQLAAGVDSRTSGNRREHRRFDLDVALTRGDELGMFRLGSTVVVVFERGAVTLSGRVGERVRFGERLGVTRRVASAGEVVA